MENLWIDLMKYDMKSLIHDIIEADDNKSRRYPNALDKEQRAHLFSSIFPFVDMSTVALGTVLPENLVEKLVAKRGDIHVVVPSNEAAVLMKYHV